MANEINRTHSDWGHRRSKKLKRWRRCCWKYIDGRWMLIATVSLIISVSANIHRYHWRSCPRLFGARRKSDSSQNLIPGKDFFRARGTCGTDRLQWQDWLMSAFIIEMLACDSVISFSSPWTHSFCPSRASNLLEVSSW